jgi:hypothetical protein
MLTHLFTNLCRVRAPLPSPSRRRVVPGVEELEARAVPAAVPTVLVVGTASVGGAVQVLDPRSGAVMSSFQPFPGFNGAVRVASGDVNGDGVADVVVAAVAPGGPIKVFDGATGNVLESFFPFPGFNGTVNIAVGDLTGAGHADLIAVANGPGSNGHVKALDETTGALVASFFSYPGFDGDVTVAAGALSRSGHDQIVTVAALNGHLKAFNLDGSLFTSPTVPGFVFSFFTFVGFRGDVSVAADDLNGDGVAELVIASGPGSSGNIRVSDGVTGKLLANFFVFPTRSTTGAFVALADVTGSGARDLVVTPGPGVQADVQTFDLLGNPLGVTYPAFANYAGGANIAATNT